ncbi:MAG: flavodoxin [Eubacterium sp.]|nr:flavodoxin [Eubacterium sp.]
MSEILVVYFSAEGTTAKLAKDIASAYEADIFEIVPVQPYTKSEINWLNPLSRCNKEMLGKKDVPVAGNIENFDQYSKVIICFPIWYGAQPNVVSTFLKDYDFNGKEVYVYATSGGSRIGKTAEKIGPYVEGAEIKDAFVVKSVDEVKERMGD